jgi:uncharacterized protein YcfJ
MLGKRIVGLAAVAVLPFLGGCASTSNTAKGAGIGGGIGAGMGALIGNAHGGKAGKGAIIGGTAGALIGGLIGNEEDQREKQALIQAKNDAEARSTNGSPMGLTDVVQLSRQGMNDGIIINQMKTTNSTFQLSTEDLKYLKDNNVSDGVISEMQNRRPGQVSAPPRIRHLPPPPPQVIHVQQPTPIYVVQPPPPPPPPGFGVGVTIR